MDKNPNCPYCGNKAEGVEVISIEELLQELNEYDPDFYFKTLLSRNNVIK